MLGDAIEQLRKLSSESVHCVVTSPPYWELRDYSRCPCAQASAGEIYDSPDNVAGPSTPRYVKQPKQDCPICHGTGIIEGVGEHQLGLEKTPEEYVRHLVEVFREVKRVLRDDGTLWLNLGDSYAGSGRGMNGDGSPGTMNSKKQRSNQGSILDLHDKRVEAGVIGRFWVSPPPGLKQKDLVGIPWRVAFALQADGWYLRSDIIWSKPNPMPESCTDRPTKSHEYVFLLAKSGKSLYWTHPELSGVRTRPKPDIRWIDRLTDIYYKEKPLEWMKGLVECPDCEGGRLESWFGDEVCSTCKGRGRVKRWYKKNLWRGHDYFWDQEAVRESAQDWGTRDRTNWTARVDCEARNQSPQRGCENVNFKAAGRNIRSIWEITTQPYPDAHFATFPEELPRRCIKAGTSQKGCCKKCGAPYERILKRDDNRHWTERGNYTSAKMRSLKDSGQRNDGGAGFEGNRDYPIGWQPTCECKAETTPCTVLDPFAGSGTTGWVARSLGRKAILIELNPVYGRLIADRTKSDIPDLTAFGQGGEVGA